MTCITTEIGKDETKNHSGNEVTMSSVAHEEIGAPIYFQVCENHLPLYRNQEIIGQYRRI